MIPVTDAIIADAIAVLTCVLVTVWACRGFWRGRADDAYQDGHAAGIETQLARTARARDRRQPGDAARPDALSAGPSVFDRIAAQLGTRREHLDRSTLEVLANAQTAIVPFPEGLPDGLREWVQHTWTPGQGGGQAVSR